jgi:transglutaminase-like putative cysteine protease
MLSSPEAPSKALLLQPEQPRSISEDSIALRTLAQLLVIVGITATMLSAADVAEPIVSGYWAIPMSIAGSVLSYFQRRKRNIGFKFLIAIGMLWALAHFLSNLVAQSNDTRLILADLLIQLQALHCFDLPRRKDLGYSVVIGLILLGVAATLSQTLAFTPFLILFLAIGLPVLVLDYRSRLGLTQASQLRKQSRSSLLAELSPRRLGAVLLAAIALGLIVFTCLPRLPGYQLRSFPVSAPIDVPGKFNNQAISNPGYVSGGDKNNGPGQGEGTEGVKGGGSSPSKGPGTLDSTQYYGFNTTINQNLRGEMTPQVVMRVRSQAEGFWRVMAFDRYTGQGWEVSRNDQTQTLVRSSFSYRFLIPRYAPSQEHREIIQTYTIVAKELPNLLPAMAQASEVYFPTREIGVDPEGGLRSPVQLTDGTTYTVLSEVPYRSRTRLNQTSTDYPEAIRQSYLEVPPTIADRVRQQTEALLATSPKPATTPYEQALYLAQALKQRYKLQSDVPFLAEDQDLVETFLFLEGGYPDHFSTALTVMLRSIGIPSRLVVGYGPGSFNPFTGLYVVRNTDAYAMTEVYFPNYGWFAFDPIPGHDLIPPSIEESDTFSLVKKLWLWIAGWLPSPLRGLLSSLFLRLTALSIVLLGWLLRVSSGDLMSILIGGIVLLSLGFVGWLLWRIWQFWSHRRWLAKLPAMESLYQELLDCLKQQGMPKQPAQTPLEYAQDLHDRCPETVTDSIDALADAYVSWRYGGRQPNLDVLNDRLRQVQSHYRQGVRRRRKLRTDRS